MVHGVKTLCLIVPLQQGEIDHPQRRKFRMVAKPQARTHFETKLAQCAEGLLARPGKEQQQVARFAAAFGSPGTQVALRVEFIDARFERPVGFATDVNHSFRTDLRTFYKFGQFVDLFAGICGASFSTDGADIFGRVEYAETFTLCQRGDIVECHSEADVGLIRTVEFHCVGPRHTRELFGHVDAENVFEQVFGHSFEQLQHVVAIDERHLAVDLCEFGLTVGPPGPRRGSSARFGNNGRSPRPSAAA